MGKPLLNGAAFLLVKMGVMPDSSGSFELKFAHQPNVHPAQLPRGLVRYSPFVYFFKAFMNASQYCLDTKRTKKIKTEKSFRAAGQTPRPAFLSGLYPP